MATKSKTAQLPRADEYAYRVHYSPEDECYIGEADEFHGLSACADTMEEAIHEIKIVVAESIQLLHERQQPIPVPLSRHQFTGELKLKIAPSLHRTLTLEATRRGVSLDQLISTKLVHA
ncbi:MAG: toxin-antitoxin system HicB family antitoxin [Acidobacteria bacterium]|nr:toxin-antitoxin system HicB family antitoxin [Acidobacteriota bacterium]